MTLTLGLGGEFQWASQHWFRPNAGWVDESCWPHEPASILVREMLTISVIGAESNVGKQAAMKNAG